MKLTLKTERFLVLGADLRINSVRPIPSDNNIRLNFLTVFLSLEFRFKSRAFFEEAGVIQRKDIGVALPRDLSPYKRA